VKIFAHREREVDDVACPSTPVSSSTRAGVCPGCEVRRLDDDGVDAKSGRFSAVCEGETLVTLSPVGSSCASVALALGQLRRLDEES
jgi:hypothetical protein